MSYAKDIEHEYTSEIVCPYCGFEFGDSWEINGDNEDLGLIECEICYKSFYATRNITIDYSTGRAKYGECKECGGKDVVIENYTSSIGTYKDLCVCCGEIEKRKMRKVYFKSVESK